jgi:predicted ArsR family transcriptional regulator
MREIKNPTQKKIVEYLEEHEFTSFGDIARDLTLSGSKALEHVQSLKNDGVIDSRSNPPYLSLNI